MHPTSKSCLRWAVALVVVGVVLVVYGTDLYLGLAELAGANADVGLDAVNLLLTLLRSTVFPMGAVLVGAAIVIQALAPASERLDHDRGGPGRSTPPT